MSIIHQNGLLRKEHYMAGFVCDFDDHAWVIKRNGKIALAIDGHKMLYGANTDPQLIFGDIEAVIETEKAVEIMPEPIKSMFEPFELHAAMKEAYRKAGGL